MLPFLKYLYIIQVHTKQYIFNIRVFQQQNKTSITQEKKRELDFTLFFMSVPLQEHQVYYECLTKYKIFKTII